MGYKQTLRVRPRGMTIARWMIFSVVVAVILASIRINAFSPVEFLFLAIAIVTLCVARILVILLYAKTCPTCEQGPVSTVTVVSFGDHYFRCSNCGQRMKRNGLGRRWDASGPEDDRYFHRENRVSTWTAPIIPRPDRPETATVGSLLREKLERIAAAPEPLDIDLPFSGESAGESPTRSVLVGVKKGVGERFFKTLDAIRWSRNPRR